MDHSAAFWLTGAVAASQRSVAKGEGPGEFKGITGIERGPDGQVVAVDYGASRLTYFKPDGALVSEGRLPPLFQPRVLRGNRLFGFKLAMLDRFREADMPDDLPMTADAYSGEVLWQRKDLAGIVGRDCFNAAVGTSTPSGGMVFLVCGNELAFFADRDATSATVVVSPIYAEAFPNERDSSEHMEAITGIGRPGGAMPNSVRERSQSRAVGELISSGNRPVGWARTCNPVARQLLGQCAPSRAARPDPGPRGPCRGGPAVRAGPPKGLDLARSWTGEWSVAGSPAPP